jgi:hypothetical protein
MKQPLVLAAMHSYRSRRTYPRSREGRGVTIVLASALVLSSFAMWSFGFSTDSPIRVVRAYDAPEENVQVELARVKSVSTVKPFVFFATAENDIGVDFAIIDDPTLNGNPNATIEVTQNYNPDEQGGTYNDHNIGVFYSGTHWAIFNQDHTRIPVGAAFNVAIVNAFVVTASADSVVGGRLVIDNNTTNNQPSALLQVTATWSSATQIYNDHAFSVGYKDGMWGIFNVDGSPIPAGALFNVWAAPFGFIQTANTANCFNDFTVLDDPSVNGNFSPIILTTPDFGGGEFGFVNNHSTGVFAGSPSPGAPPNWAIFNQDQTAVQVGASFSVTAFNPPVIQNVSFSGKKMFITGLNFDTSATVMINGQTTPTAQDPDDPTTSLICKKGGKLIQPGDTVTLQILDGNTVLSTEFPYQRPSSE